MNNQLSLFSWEHIIPNMIKTGTELVKQSTSQLATNVTIFSYI